MVIVMVVVIQKLDPVHFVVELVLEIYQLIFVMELVDLDTANVLSTKIMVGVNGLMVIVKLVF